jgi:hypothetical protein
LGFLQFFYFCRRFLLLSRKISLPRRRKFRWLIKVSSPKKARGNLQRLKWLKNKNL